MHVLWQVWKERNAKLWDGQCKSPSDSVHASAALLGEWSSSRLVPINSTIISGVTRRPCGAWHPPPAGFWKLNVDAAFSRDSFQTGFGMVVRDEHGSFIAVDL